MPDLIVIRLHPEKPTAAADFTTYLDGLTVTAFDLSCGDPTVGKKVGDATYIAPPSTSTGIFQHVNTSTSDLESVATAVIEVSSLPAGYKEYVTADLRIEVQRGTTVIVDKAFYYDVPYATVGVIPTPENFQDQDLLPTSLYLKLRRPVAPDIASVELRDDGTPPNFKAVKDAVNAVIADDQQSNPPAALGNLTANQARHIAYEIIWGAQDPLPGPPPASTAGFDDIGELYTNPPNDGTLTAEQKRVQFEGNLNSYYAIRNANVDRLARFIFALSTAVKCEDLSKNASLAFLRFPPSPAKTGQQTTIHSAEVLLVDEDDVGDPLVPAFEVPAEYFYVLGAQLPTQIGADQRFRMACRDDQERLLPVLTTAFDDGTITPVPTVNPAQAVRRLTALAPESDSVAPRCKLDASVLPLVNDWLGFPNAASWRKYQSGDDPVKFWIDTELGSQPLPYLHLVLCALTDGHEKLIDAIIAIPIGSVAELADMKEADWKNLFGKPPNVELLPPFTAPGTPEARLAAFIRHVQKFFDVPFETATVPPATADSAPVLDLPTRDAIAEFVTQYELLIGGSFTFGSGPLNEAYVKAAVETVFLGDPPAQSWLNQRVQLINDLCLLAEVESSTTLPPKLSQAFSIAEALYARGFTSADDIKALTLADFADALRGTVAYSHADGIYTNAEATASPPVAAPGPFQPINPGSLINCIPPCYLSPLGLVNYLHELLELSEASTCRDPFAPPPAGHKKLGEAIAERRGQLGNLAVTAANADSELPLIDIVNESLEYLAATASSVGIVHDTATDTVAGHKLCAAEEEAVKDCHQPGALLDALPEHSSPAVAFPEGAPPQFEFEAPAYDKLRQDFSAPTLPYSQPLDICRTYLDHFRTCRFEAMRTFRQDITEFTLDPDLKAPTFQSHLWRYPVRIDIGIEYLQINPEEYALLFTKDIVDVPTPGHLVLHELYGFDVPNPGGYNWIDIVLVLPEFLKRTGLSYCELVELQKSGCFEFVAVYGDDEGQLEVLPACQPCCLEHYKIHFVNPANTEEALKKLVVFLRLWRKLQDVCGARYTFAELCDICEVLQLFIGTAINPDFIRQLVAFQILRDGFQLKLTDGTTSSGTYGADRTHILALWVGVFASKWTWAVGHLLSRIQHYAKTRHESHDRPPRFVKLLAENLDPLSILAGFNSASPSDTWHARPTNTLRFAQILAKIYASHFGVGEVLYLFTADDHLDGDDPFPLQDVNESQDYPLSLPEDDDIHSLLALRQALLAAEVSEDDERAWTWPRIDAALRQEFGYEVPSGGTDYLTSLGQHFFPSILEQAGIPVSASERQYQVDLASSTPDMWNIPPDGPFRFISTGGTGHLATQVPLRDEAVITKLERLRDLDSAESQAVQNLYYMPRVDLAPFACFFPSFAAAERHLIEERDEAKRWHWFRHQFARAYKRCHMIVDHLVRHVAAATEFDWKGGYPTAWLIVQRLFADENRAKTTWEADSGEMPDRTWKPLPSGGGFAALLGLTGTGLLGEVRRANNALAWREVRGPMNAFGHEKNTKNTPVPTIVPAMDLNLAPEQLRFIELRNGFAVQDQHGKELGGAESFVVTWSGVLLVDEEGNYEFTAGAPTPEGEKPDRERAKLAHWRVTLTRGQKKWILLNHRWPGERGQTESSLSLSRGAYGIVVEFVQPPPDFSLIDDIYPQHTGFQVKYTGPDTGDRPETLPLERLYRNLKDNTLDIDMGVPENSTAAVFLKLQYTSTLRDIRRTYQRAFKALLFAHRFGLSGHRLKPYQQSELGYMLDHPDLFLGVSYYRNPDVFSRHAANFDFNFLPLKDQYHPPSPTQDQRAQPSPKREQALFDWWERMYDYTRMRRARERSIERPVWLLFQEALEKQPDNPAHLLRHLDVDLRHAPLVLSYFASQVSPVVPLTFTDLEDDRWAVRVWHGDRWVLQLLRHFAPLDIRAARPDLWASGDPRSLAAGETETGNANLSRFLCEGCFENGEPRRYTDVKLLDDRLREHARSALLAYLCGMNRVPLPWGGTATWANDLSALLLMDVEVGLCEKASRVEEAIAAIQNFVQRARLGLEAGWTITAEFVHLWEHEFALFRVWEKCKCRSLYKENWIEWDELRKARKIEAFQFFEAELRRSTLTIATPGGLEYWPATLPPVHPAVNLLQKRESSALRLFNPREGLGVLGTPERDARPSWLAPDFGKEGDQEPAPSTPTEAPVGIIPIASPTTEFPADAQNDDAAKLPYWIQAAIRLGVKFVRVAAGGVPPAATDFRPSDFHEEPGCCEECGCVHPALVDEYYFWLVAARAFDAVEQDEYYDPTQQVSIYWHDEKFLPTLLDWKSAPAARLAWCRVHNGEFKQPRRSDEVLKVTPGSIPDLTYLGRIADSLTFSVSGGTAPVGYNGADAPGFRYDMATDSAVPLPLVGDPPALPSPYPAGLPVYPYFIFVEPGDRLFPDSPFSPAVAMANVLRCHCRFEAALKWYQLVLHPLLVDNTWVHCAEDIATPPPLTPTLFVPADVPSGGAVAPGLVSVLPPAMCCDSTKISAEVARNRSIILLYLETLVEWSRALTRRYSRESAQQARLVLDTAAMILGPCPRIVVNHQLPEPQTVTTFVPLIPPLNPQLIQLYCHVRDGLALVRRCLTASRLRDTTKDCRPPYWGQDPCSCGPIDQYCGCESTEEPCCGEGEWCRPHSPYRFTFLLQKAQEATAKVRELGAGLLSAFDRGDAEYLASMRARHEEQLADLTIKVRQEQWREADWQVKALGKTKEVSQTNRRHYKRLIDLGLNMGELGYQSNTLTAIELRSSAIPIEAVGESMRLIPDLYVGTCEEAHLPLGTKLGEMFQAIARITNEHAEIASLKGALDLTQAGWDRRLVEWIHQVEVLDIEIEQIEIQIMGAERRRDQALEELNIQQRQLEQSREMLDVLRDKFTSHELYLFLQKETAALYWRMYELARELSVQAQRTFNFELGYSRRNFLPCEDWDTLHEGLHAGERLQFALQRIETEYLECNRREYELTKHISLALHFPLQFLRLKITGCCEIEIPEWMFDIDYPGHYMRRIKNVSLTIPCVTGPYTGVHCRLTLLRSQTRIDPCLSCPVTECCDNKPVNPCGCRHEMHEHYEACGGDPRIMAHYGAREAIATSSGQNDSGLFELSFRDERHLPFEFFGAVSCWRIEIPPENNYFDMNTLTDVVMHKNYTACEGGDPLREAARASASKRLPANGWIFIDLPKDFPDAWELFRRSRKDRESERSMTIQITRNLFPFLPSDPALKITSVAVLFETKDCREHPCPDIRGCPCAHEDILGSHLVEVTVDHPDEEREGSEEVEIICVSSADWPRLYYGVGQVKVEPFDGRHARHNLVLTFGHTVGELTRAFLLCRYEAIERCCQTVRCPQENHLCC